jgi:pathogenesis-related protein 1
MPTRTNPSLACVVVSLLAVAACTKTEGDPGFDMTGTPSADDSGAATDAGGGKGAPSDDGAVDDSSSPGQTTSGSDDSGRADTGGPEDAGMGASDDAEADGASAGDQETGRLVGMTAAHNAVRAMVMTQPALPPLTWSSTLAEYAQAWATQLAADPSTCAQPVHRSMMDLEAKDYGENLAAFYGRGGTGDVSTAQQAVNAWASEVACWTYGTIDGTEQCNMSCTTNLSSDGCGHYTQIVWRKSLLLGCGVATCQNGQGTEDIWICNYSPAGNVVGQAPY